MTNYRTKLAEFRALEPDWDGYSAVPGDPDTLEAVRIFLESVIAGTIDLVPESDGGLQIECHTNGFDIAIEFCPRQRGYENGEAVGSWERTK